MANLIRVRTEWSGSPVVGPGVSTFYLAETATGFLTAFNSFWVGFVTRVPVGVTWTTPNTGDLIDVDTGGLSGTWTDGTTSTVTSTGTGPFPSAVGARVKWATSGVRNNRRVRGSTFICPLTNSCFQSDGTIDTTVLTAMNTIASGLFTALGGDMRIYSRPVAGAGGQASVVTGGLIPDKVSWLRSRRV